MSAIPRLRACGAPLGMTLLLEMFAKERQELAQQAFSILAGHATIEIRASRGMLGDNHRHSACTRGGGE